MKMFRRVFGVFILFCLTWAVFAQDLTISNSTPPDPIDYSPFAPSSGTGNLTVKNNRSSSYNYFFSCYTPLSSRYASQGGYTIPFFVYKNEVTPLAQVLPWSRSLTYNNALWGTIGKKGTAYQSYDIVPEVGHWVPAGPYTGNIKFELDEGIPGQDNLQGSVSPTISIQVLPITDISLVTSGTTFDVNAVKSQLDFGELVAGAERSLNVLVRSNKNWSLSVLVPSKGYMVSTSTDTPIPYLFYFGGKLVDISSGSASLIPFAYWTASGQKDYQMKFVIGAFDNVDPGLYNDSLSIMITAF